MRKCQIDHGSSIQNNLEFDSVCLSREECMERHMCRYCQHVHKDRSFLTYPHLRQVIESLTVKQYSEEEVQIIQSTAQDLLDVNNKIQENNNRQKLFQQIMQEQNNDNLSNMSSHTINKLRKFLNETESLPTKDICAKLTKVQQILHDDRVQTQKQIKEKKEESQVVKKSNTQVNNIVSEIYKAFRTHLKVELYDFLIKYRFAFDKEEITGQGDRQRSKKHFMYHFDDIAFGFVIVNAKCQHLGIFQSKQLVTGQLILTESLNDQPIYRIVEGKFTDGIAYDTVRIYRSDGEIFEGETMNNKMHGYGEYQGRIIDSDIPYKYLYQGEFKDDQFEGRGDQKSDIFKYSGNFHNSCFSGYGRLTDLVHDSVYEGNFKDHMKNGYGQITTTGFKYVGEWRNDQFDGEGVFVRYKTIDNLFPNLKDYMGQFKEGMRWGHGQETMFNGDTFTGEFKKDIRIEKPQNQGLNPEEEPKKTSRRQLQFEHIEDSVRKVVKQ